MRDAGGLHGPGPALHDRAGRRAEHALARRAGARPPPRAVREPLRLGAVARALADAVREEAALLLDALEPAGEAELRRGFAGPLAAAVVTRSLGLSHADADAVLGHYDAIVGAVNGPHRRPAGAPPAQAASTRWRRSARRAADSCAARRAPALAAASSLQRRRDAVRRDRDDRGDDRQRARVPARRRRRARAGATTRAADRGGGGVAAARARRRRDRPLRDRGRRLGGAEIAAGELVRISITAANRDPATFPDPDRFDPRRDNARRHLAFAGGPHVCVGMHLARLEAHTALALLLERLPRLRLDPARPPEIRGLVFRKPPELRVLWASGLRPRATPAGTGPLGQVPRPRPGRARPRRAGPPRGARGCRGSRSAPTRGSRRGSRSPRRP